MALRWLTSSVLMVMPRSASLAAKRAADIWPRPSREPGRWPACWPLPPAVGRRTADLPPLALPACLSTLETEALALAFASVLRRARAHPEMISGRRGRSWRVCKLRRVRACEARGHACIGACLAPHAARRRSRAVPRHPHVQIVAGAECLKPLPLAFRLCPSLPLRHSAARRRCCTSSQPAGEDAQWPQARRVRGKTPARWAAAPRQREVRCECTRTARATTRRRTDDARWHDERRAGKVQRIGGHHGRVSSQIGCATPITASSRATVEIAAVERRRVGRAQQEQFARLETAAKLQGWQRPAQPVGRQGGYRHAVDANLAGDDANGVCGATAPTRLSSGTRVGR